MKAYLKIGCVLSVFMMCANPALGVELPVLDELDSFWAEISRTVSEGDFPAYKETYHQDAIVVSGISKTSQPASRALAEWEEGFTQTRSGNNTVSLEFRFTQRINDATTAHETGIFCYTSTGAEGKPNVTYIHFEALLVKQHVWKTLMEYQTALASPEEWTAAALTPIDP